MSFLASIKRIFRAKSPDHIAPTRGTSPRTGGVPFWVSGPDGMEIATVYRCVTLLSNSVASLPLERLKRRGGIFVAAPDDRLDYLLNVQPNEWTSAHAFWGGVTAELLLAGNAYIVPQYDAATPTPSRFILCTRGSVSHDTTTDTYTVSDTQQGVSGTFDESDIIHIKGFTTGRQPKIGLSVLSFARLALDIAGAGDTETRNRFVNGGNVRGIVSNDTSVRGFGEYQDAELEKTARSLDERFSSGERIVGLPGQVDFKQISLSSTDMQFLESRKFTVLEICRFFGVHPSFVFQDTSNNYKSAEQANVAFLSHTLNPLLCNIESELRRKLISPRLALKYEFRFNRKSLHACDLDTLTRYRAGMLQTGATVNEVRRMENQPPVEGGDVALVSEIGRASCRERV